MAAAVRTSPANNPMAHLSNKRKRTTEDVGRPSEEVDATATTADDDVFSAQLLQHVEADNQRTTAEAALAAQSYPDPYHGPNAVNAPIAPAFGNTDGSPDNQNVQPQVNRGGTKNKANQKDDEWHSQRKASHKEVERRRREVINEGIENIAKTLPSNSDNTVANEAKNKGAILQRARNYILKLTENEAKMESERQVFNVTIEEMTKRNEALQASNRQAWNDAVKWQDRCRALGGDFDDYDSHGPASFDDPTDLEALQS